MSWSNGGKSLDPLPLLSGDQSKAMVEVVLGKLERAAKIQKALLRLGGWQAGEFSDFLKSRSAEVRNLAEGDFLLWCGGWMGTSVSTKCCASRRRQVLSLVATHVERLGNYFFLGRTCNNVPRTAS